MSLARAEWTRLFGRRFTKIMVVVVLLVLAAISLGLGFTSHPHNAAAMATANAQLDQVRASIDRQIADCEASQQRQNPTGKNGTTDGDTTGKNGGTGGGAVKVGDGGGGQYPPGVDCAQMMDWHPRAEMYLPHQFSFRDDVDDAMTILGYLLALFAFAIGASFIGAEWSSGGMMNLLLWRPRRLPLLAGKLGTLLTGVFGTGLLISVAWVAGVYGMARLRGDASGFTAGLLRSLALTEVRVLVLAMGAAILGFGIASLGRHTATALGVVVGYAIVFELGLRIVLHLAHVVRPERWFLSSYIGAWLNKTQRYFDYTPCDVPHGPMSQGPGPCNPIIWTITTQQGALIGGILVAVILAWTFVSFRRRDIT